MKFKVKKQTIRRLRRDKRVRMFCVVFLVLLGIVVGMLSTALFPYHQHPANLVWAADASVQIPDDLILFLQAQDNCKNYQSKDGPKGVGLWGVFKVSGNKFAKISYGCSTNLTQYLMAVKGNDGWQLLDSAQYFGATGILPKCTQVEKYHIDKSIESFCVKDDGSASSNQQ